jgi:predicted transcriptional regulator
MGSSTLSLRVDDDVIDALDAMTADSPASRSALAREAVVEGLKHLDGVPDWVENDAEAQSIINQNKRESWEGAFRSEVVNRLKASFESDRTPAEFEKSISGYIDEADRLGKMPEETAADAPDGVETYREWVGYMLEYYRTAYDAQEFDHDPMNNPLGNHEGIDRAGSWVEATENIERAGRDAPPSEARKKRRQAARAALESGDVPAHVKERAHERARSQDGGTLADGLVEVALAENDSALTDTDNPELED